MKKQVLSVAIENAGAIQQIGKGIMYVPVGKYQGGGVKWYEDKLKQSVQRRG